MLEDACMVQVCKCSGMCYEQEINLMQVVKRIDEGLRKSFSGSYQIRDQKEGEQNETIRN